MVPCASRTFQFERFFVTSAKTRPMILRLASGSFSPASARTGSDLLRYVNNVQTKMVAKHVHHLLGFVERNRPLSTNTQVEFTDGAVQQHRGDGESTPPERPRITLSSPACSRMRATASSIIFAGVTVLSHCERYPRTEAAPACAYWRVWSLPEWNCTP